MKKHLCIILTILSITSFNSSASEGLLLLTADKAGWTIYINSVKKAITPEIQDQAIQIKLPEGSYTIDAVKDINKWNEFRESKQIFIGASVIQPVHIKLEDAEWISKTKPKSSTIEHNRQQMAKQGWVDNGDGTVTHKKTNLTWKRCYEGQIWTGNSCAGEPTNYKLHEAIQLRSNYAGTSNWRLPTIDELHTLVYCTEGRYPISKKGNDGKDLKSDRNGNGACLGENYQIPTVNLAVFPMSLSSSWSSTPYGIDGKYGWSISFLSGSESATGLDFVTITNNVRLVRGVQR